MARAAWIALPPEEKFRAWARYIESLREAWGVRPGRPVAPLGTLPLGLRIQGR